ncbi:hypothetical protein V493_00696 [Pseudogymnoascus sp. VKM F-4281 (FW-2241)]|nr:hypothetical protein V493_00696 [Pseudogymnoascus sp. VKM F-4281 (FW-2241)]
MISKYTKKHDIQHFIRATPDPVIERAVAATQRARVSMVRKYTKRHDIQHFDIGAIVSIKVPREDRTSTDNKRLFARILEELDIGAIVSVKVPREDRTSTDNKRLFARILEEPYPHRYRILTASGIIQRLIPTKSLGVVEQALWADIIIPTSTKEVGLGLAAREASTSARVGISCQCKGQWLAAREASTSARVGISCLTTRTEIASVERPKRKRVGGSAGQLANENSWWLGRNIYYG